LAEITRRLPDAPYYWPAAHRKRKYSPPAVSKLIRPKTANTATTTTNATKNPPKQRTGRHRCKRRRRRRHQTTVASAPAVLQHPPIGTCGPAEPLLLSTDPPSNNILVGLTRDHAARLVAAVLRRRSASSSSSSATATATATNNAFLAFECTVEPRLPVDTYAVEFVRYGISSPESFMTSLALIRRLIIRHPTFPVTVLTVHRLLATALLIASKFVDDHHLSNSDFARIAQLSTAEMNELEINLLLLLDHQLCIDADELPAVDL
jgi:hypothetical protein